MSPFLQFFLDRPYGALALLLGFALFSWLCLRRWWVRHAGRKAVAVALLFLPVYAASFTYLSCSAWRSWGRFLPLAFLALVLLFLCVAGPRRRPPPRRIG
jgi:peptidoglycan/LPS O-acetylase OafA/YrhL